VSAGLPRLDLPRGTSGRPRNGPRANRPVIIARHDQHGVETTPDAAAAPVAPLRRWGSDAAHCPDAGRPIEGTA
jgi:hypothetical protein